MNKNVINTKLPMKLNLQFFGETGLHKKLNDLKAEKGNIFQQAEAAVAEGDIEKARGLKAQIETLNGEIETVSGIIELSAQNLSNISEPGLSPNDDENLNKKLTEMRASNEYMNAFFTALKSGETVRSAKGKEDYNVLFNALTETGGNPVGSEGGFLLPIDFDNKIWELKKTYVNLSDLVLTENVTYKTGWRARERNVNLARLVKTEEMQVIPNATEPKFIKIEYSIDNYAGLIPVSQDLLDDTPVNIMDYLARWMARLSANTENSEIIKILNDKLTGSLYDTAKGIRSLKNVLNKDLRSAISASAVILTNQSGFDFLDQLEDGNKRPLLQPDVVNPTQYKILGRRVVTMDDDLLVNDVNGAPLYVGDFKEFMHFFRRKSFEMAATNVGAGAFETNSTIVRGIERFDQKVFDEKAVVKLEIPVVS